MDSQVAGSEDGPCARCGTLTEVAWNPLLLKLLCALCRNTITEAELRFPGRGEDVAGVIGRRADRLVIR